jgi:hypothetical protein
LTNFAKTERCILLPSNSRETHKTYENNLNQIGNIIKNDQQIWVKGYDEKNLIFKRSSVGSIRNRKETDGSSEADLGFTSNLNVIHEESMNIDDLVIYETYHPHESYKKFWSNNEKLNRIQSSHQIPTNEKLDLLDSINELVVNRINCFINKKK